MSYFSADERLERGETVPPAPYNLRLTEVDERSAEIGLAWQRPLGRVEGYLILVPSSEFRVPRQDLGNETRDYGLQTLDSKEWRTVEKVLGREKSGARVHLAAELWGAEGIELVVVAFCGEVISPPSNPVKLAPRLHLPPIIKVVPQEVTPPVSDVVTDIVEETVPPPVIEAEASSRQTALQPEETHLAGWAEIEEALRRNSAALGKHGLFVRRDN